MTSTTASPAQAQPARGRRRSHLLTAPDKVTLGVMAGIPTELQNGFWLGLGLALAFLVWGTLQLLIHRAEGSR